VRVTISSATADATAALGARLASLLEAGDVVSLAGPLGAGKTRFVQGLADGLGVEGRVTSPTFVLVRRYAGRLPLLHCDAYRLERTGDLGELDDDLLADDVVTCVEWGDAVAAALPSERLEVLIVPRPERRRADAGVAGADVAGVAGADVAPREVSLVGHGASWARRWDALEHALRSEVDA